MVDAESGGYHVAEAYMWVLSECVSATAAVPVAIYRQASANVGPTVRCLRPLCPLM